MANLFAGRMMKCEKCGFQFKSSMEFESMWTTVQVDDKLIDYCPFCWGIPRRLWPEQVKVEWDAFHLAKQRSDRQKGD